MSYREKEDARMLGFEDSTQPTHYALPTTYNAVWQILPGVAQITLREQEFVVVLYDQWKERVIARQTQEKANA
ncbi:MAG: hypothetical protein JW850_13480 [Thermoflexales bacterium]|nr:hypothetical protein [Thermoflexales bacterium]